MTRFAQWKHADAISFPFGQALELSATRQAGFPSEVFPGEVKQLKDKMVNFCGLPGMYVNAQLEMMGIPASLLT